QSTEDGAQTLSALAAPKWKSGKPKKSTPIIKVDPSLTYQSILGFGGSLDHATCYNLSRLEESKRRAVMEKLVDPVVGIGMNLMRLSIGTSDFTGDPWYSYDDSPDNQPDPSLSHFSIDKDRTYLLPAIKLAQSVNDDLLYFASPW